MPYRFLTFLSFIYVHVFNIVKWISFDLVNVLIIKQMYLLKHVCFEHVDLTDIDKLGISGLTEVVIFLLMFDGGEGLI